MSNEKESKSVIIWTAIMRSYDFQYLRAAVKACGIGNFDTAYPAPWAAAMRDMNAGSLLHGVVWDYTENTIGGMPVNVHAMLFRELCKCMEDTDERRALYTHIGRDVEEYYKKNSTDDERRALYTHIGRDVEEYYKKNSTD